MAGQDQTYAEGDGAARAVSPGTQLGRFTLRHVLGEGGMGVVWAAHDPDLDREIAIKLLRTHAQASPALRKRLLREARAMARLKHPNVITVYEVGSSGDTDFIAMELVDGLTLDTWLTHDPAREDIWRAVIAAGRGLAAAHAAELVHRDFKPHNVLRSRDGRVLVTDFGLARGLGDDPIATELDAATPLARTPTDSLLDSPLTQTGVMIGTPAYMAPEQFHGAPPDPRTDQFAYCISTWQALTGARPFTGETLEELRDAALRGVGDVVAELAKPVRAVLARGLDRDPAKRWPDMATLLDALEVAGRVKPRRLLPFIAPIAALAAAGAIVMIAKRDTPRVAATCEPAADVFAEAWNAGARTELKASEAAGDRIARSFEQFRDRWTATYQEACNAPRTKVVEARLACLRGVRDETVVVRYALRGAETRVLEGLNLVGLLPNLAMCSAPAPIPPPIVPKEQPRRGQALDVLARSMSLRWTPRAELAAATSKLVTDAVATTWKPLVPIVQVTAANIHLFHHAFAEARVLFRDALKTADVRFQAMAHLGLLEASIRELETPSRGLHEIEKALMYARSSVRAAENDPVLVGALSLLEAEAKAAQALWSRYRAPYRDALEFAADARKQFAKVDDARRIARVTSVEARMHLARGNERALDDALFVVRSAEEMLANGGLDPSPALTELRAEIAFAKGDYREAHEHDDRLPRDRAGRGPAMQGRVVDKQGKPVKATVAAFTGVLRGDPVRVYTNPHDTDEIVETDGDGRFEIHVGTAVVAQAGALRSGPRNLEQGMVVVVEPTQSVTGVVGGARVPTLTATGSVGTGVRYAVHAAIGKDGTYRLDGVPRGATFGIEGPAGTGTRRIQGKQLVWPNGPAIEVIVRASELRATATAYVFRGKVWPRTRQEADVLVAKAGDVAMSFLEPIGADATEAGRETYEPGDAHAVIIGNLAGEVTVCVVLTELPDAAMTCSGLTVEEDPAKESARVRAVLFKTGA